MTKYTIRSPEPRFNGDLAGLVFRAGEANAETPADLAAVTYCQRRGYSVVAVDSKGEPLPENQQPDADTPDFVENQNESGDDDEGADQATDAVKRPANYAPKAEWVTYAVSRGATEEDADTATMNELVELYG